jgi:PAS domain S-box-containing protein
LTNNNKKSLLLVNDVLNQLRLATVILEKANYEVHAFQHAEEALQFLRGGKEIQAVITDLHMPEIDGWKLCRLLRSPEYFEYNDIPILIISSTFSGTDTEEITKDTGANAFLSIPFSPEELKKQVKALIDGEKIKEQDKVLIVEDDPLQTVILKNAFKSNGYEVSTASSGTEAKAIFYAGIPDIVILDYHLPDMKGEDLLSLFKRPEYTTIAIIMTAERNPDLAVKLMKYGADAFIRKPFNPSYLLDLCSKAQRERSLLRVENLLEDRSRQLIESEERYRTLFESIPSIVFVLDFDGKILHINKTGAKILEWKVDELVGKNIFMNILVENDTALLPLQRTNGKKQNLKFENKFRTKNKNIIFTESILSEVPFDSGSAILCISHDVTDRKRVEFALEESSALNRTVISHLPEGVVLLNAAHKVVHSNKLGRKYLDKLASFDAKKSLQKLGPFELSEILSEHSGELPFEIKEEEYAASTYEAKAKLISHDEYAWVLTIQDVTKVREVQRQLKMQERLATIGQLAAGIAHDFNNILTSIIGLSQLLTMRNDLPAVAHDYLEKIVKQSNRAAGLIQQILDFSRQSVITTHPLDFLGFIKETIKLLKHTLPENIDIKLQAEPGEYIIETDPVQLQQALVNLAVNSRDAMPDGGELQFRLSICKDKDGKPNPCSDLEAASWLHLNISDTGHGIKEDTLAHIFEPFFTTKEKGKGTGLGLSQVYGIIQQHYGCIKVESEVDAGSNFHIYLPIYEEEHKPEPEKRLKKIPKGHGEIILLVEDNSTVLEVEKNILKNFGYEIISATDGQKALELFKSKQDDISLVITDMTMPGMDGLQLFNELKTLNPNVKVIMLTGYPLGDSKEEMKSFGISSWIQKPFQSEMLAKEVNYILKNKKNSQTGFPTLS